MPSRAVGEVPGANDTAKTTSAKTGSTTHAGRPTNGSTAAHYTNYGVYDTRNPYTVSSLVDNDWDALNSYYVPNIIEDAYTRSINGSGVTVVSKDTFTNETDPRVVHRSHWLIYTQASAAEAVPVERQSR